MSILIKGMEMPRACVFCELYDGDLYWCRGAKKEVPYSPEDKRANWCPLVEVPTPHGRLVDADALKDWSEIVPLTGDGGIDINDFDEKLGSMPTIIEAEEGSEE